MVVPRWNWDNFWKILEGLKVRGKGRADVNLSDEPEVYRRVR